MTLPVRFRLCVQDQSSSYRGGWTEDLSSGGLQLRCTPVEFVSSEAEIHAQVRLGDDCWINATGKVAWMKTSRLNDFQLLGICFVDLGPGERDTLRDFVEPRHSE